MSPPNHAFGPPVRKVVTRSSQRVKATLRVRRGVGRQSPGRAGSRRTSSSLRNWTPPSATFMLSRSESNTGSTIHGRLRCGPALGHPHRPPKTELEGQHPRILRRQSRTPPRRPGRRPCRPSRRSQSPAPDQGLAHQGLRLHDQPRRASDQQHLRTGNSTLGRLPQGHRWL